MEVEYLPQKSNGVIADDDTKQVAGDRLLALD